MSRAVRARRPWARWVAGCLVLLLVATTLPGPAPAAPEPGSGDRPAARMWTRAVYDTAADRVILFGGGNVSAFNDTWAYDMATNTWTRMHPPVSPSARMGHAMAYDAESDRVILFGGVPSNPPCTNLQYTPMLGDTWAYDLGNDTWTLLAPVHSPNARYFHAMAYDAQSDRVVLYGGQERGLAVKNDTWAFDFEAGDWQKMSPATPPHGRAPEEMVYDSAADRLVISGGWTPWGHPSNETWAYDYDNDVWQQVATVHAPPQRDYHHLAYDARIDSVLLFGGAWEDQSMSDLWVLDNLDSNWTLVQTAGFMAEGRAGAAFVYVPDDGRVFLFGGARVDHASASCFGADIRTVVDDQWAYDSATNQWTPLSGSAPSSPPDLFPPFVTDAGGLPLLVVILAAAAVVVYIRRRGPPPEFD